MIHKFRCHRCSSKDLSFEKLITVRAEVTVHDDGHVEYGEFHVPDETIDQSPVFNFICRDCGWHLHIDAYKIELESDLQHYLNIPSDDISAANEAYYSDWAEREAECDAEYEALHENVG